LKEVVPVLSMTKIYTCYVCVILGLSLWWRNKD